MSIQAMGWVLEHSHAQGLDRLVLLAIANHADAKGLNAWPSVDLIVSEARVGRATVFRSLERLQRLGELEVLKGGGRGNRNHYRIPMKRSHGETLWYEEETVSESDLTVSRDREKVSPVQINGLNGDTQNRQEPSKALSDRQADPKGPAVAEPEEPPLPPEVLKERVRALRGAP